MRSIGPLDHVIVLVRDLGQAAREWARLGFRPTPQALHSAAMGTTNSTIVFENRTYLELLAVRQETPLSAGFVAQLREREGPFGIACKTDDALLAAEEFEAAGVAGGAAVDFARPVELAEGTREAAFSIARLQPGATPGASMFVCQHRTPEVVWRPDYLEQPNGVTGLVEVVGVAADLEPLRAAYAPLFGPGLEPNGDALVIRTATASIRFLSPLAYAARFGQIVASGRPQLAALVFRTRDLKTCRATLEDAAGVVAQTARGTLVLPLDGKRGGTMLEFVPAGVA